MKRLIIPLFSFLLISCGSGSSDNSESGSSSGDKPTKEDIESALHKQYDTPGDNFTPKHDVEIHEVKIGDTEGTNEQDKIDGIPAKADVTMAKVEITERSYYTDKTTTRRREITAKVFKDDFGDWKVMTDASREISGADEPAQPK
jgi:hypothetical protein